LLKFFFLCIYTFDNTINFFSKCFLIYLFIYVFYIFQQIHPREINLPIFLSIFRYGKDKIINFFELLSKVSLHFSRSDWFDFRAFLLHRSFRNFAKIKRAISWSARARAQETRPFLCGWDTCTFKTGNRFSRDVRVKARHTESRDRSASTCENSWRNCRFRQSSGDGVFMPLPNPAWYEINSA